MGGLDPDTPRALLGRTAVLAADPRRRCSVLMSQQARPLPGGHSSPHPCLGVLTEGAQAVKHSLPTPPAPWWHQERSHFPEGNTEAQRGWLPRPRALSRSRPGAGVGGGGPSPSGHGSVACAGPLRASGASSAEQASCSSGLRPPRSCQAPAHPAGDSRVQGGA